MKFSSIALLCVSLYSPLAAQANDEVGSWEFNAAVSSFSIDSDAAVQEGVEDSALHVGLYADYLQSSWVSTIGMSFLIYDDNLEFKQQVVGTGLYNDGDVSTESSSANALLIDLATGYRWTFGENESMDVIAQGGFSFAAYSERSIGSCTNCYSEDIDLSGGAFVKTRVGHNGESMRIGLMLQQYLSGDFGTVVGLEIGSSF